MEFTVKEFRGTDKHLWLVLVPKTPPTLAVDVGFLLPDDTLVAPADITINDLLTDPTDPRITYEVLGDFSEGIFEAQIKDTVIGHDFTFLVGNLKNGIVCMMLKAVNEDFDVILFTQLEAVKHFVLTNNRTLAITTYNKVANKCVSCTGDITYNVSNTDLCITSSAYKMI